MIQNIGENRNKGNLIGIQPVMKTGDYRSKEAFLNKIESYFIILSSQNLLNQRTVVVFPEYIGTWLIAANSNAYKKKNVSSAMIFAVLPNLYSFLKHLIKYNLVVAAFRSRSASICKIYDETFSYLSKKYELTIVPGTLVVSEPHIVGGKLTTKEGALYNASVVYKPDGRAEKSIVKKVFLTTKETGFTSPGEVSSLPVFDTKAGRLAVLICADSWFQECYDEINKKGAEVLVVPSYLQPRDVWQKHWIGDQNNSTNLTEKEAWLKMAMAQKIKSANMKTGINVFLRGDFWGLGSDGETIVFANNKARTIHGNEAITNIWL